MRSTACSPAPGPESSRTRATAGPLTRSRTGSKSVTRVASWRPCICASTPASSTSKRACANPAPPITAAAATIASGRRPAVTPATSAAASTASAPAATSSSPATSAASTRCRGCARAPARPRAITADRSYTHLLAKRRQLLLADPGNLVELVNGPEPAVLGAEVDDLLRRRGPDAVERVELLERGGVEVDRLGRRGRRGRGRGRRRGTRGTARHEDLAPVL